MKIFFLFIFGFVAFAGFQAGFDVSRVPMALVFFVVASAGIVWALAKI